MRHGPDMPYPRIYLTVGITLSFAALSWAAAFAQSSGSNANPLSKSLSSATSATDPPTEAERTLDNAIRKIKGLKSVSAKVRQDAEILDQKFQLDGVYRRAPGNRVFFQLGLKGLGKATGTMLQVCDGRTLWDFQEVLGTRSVRKTDIAKVLTKLQDPLFDSTIKEQILGGLGFSGPDALLAGLRKSFRFDQKQETTLDGQSAWLLRGNWNDFAALSKPGQPPLPPTVNLPPYVPSFVSLWIGKESGWPLKVEMLGKTPSLLGQVETRRPDAKGVTVPGSTKSAPKAKVQVPASAQVQRSKLTLTYSDVSLDETLDPADFAFEAPRDANVLDSTEEILNGLDQYLLSLAAQKKAESAREGTNPASTVPNPASSGGLLAPSVGPTSSNPPTAPFEPKPKSGGQP